MQQISQSNGSFIKGFGVVAGVAIAAWGAIQSFQETDGAILVVNLFLSGFYGVMGFLVIRAIAAVVRHVAKPETHPSSPVHKVTIPEAGSRPANGEERPSSRLPERLLLDLETIGSIKDGLPPDQQSWCDSLGLHVYRSKAMGFETLQAGDGEALQLDASRELPIGRWRVEQYRQGDWENLVEPTRQLATWVAVRGVTEETIADFLSAIDGFRRTKTLKLA